MEAQDSGADFVLTPTLHLQGSLHVCGTTNVFELQNASDISMREIDHHQVHYTVSSNILVLTWGFEIYVRLIRFNKHDIKYLMWLSWMGCFGHWTMKGSHGMGTAFDPQTSIDPKLYRTILDAIGLRCWIPNLYKKMTKHLRKKLQKSGKGMVKKAVTKHGTISVLGPCDPNILVPDLHCYYFL